MNATMEAKTELQALLDTALRVKNEGLEERFDMLFYERLCGTHHCLAGWHLVFREGSYISGMGSAYSDAVSLIVYPQGLPYDNGTVTGRAWNILFGSHRGEGADALSRQIRAIRWFLHRIEALEEYERIRAMPKRERRRLKVAA